MLDAAGSKQLTELGDAHLYHSDGSGPADAAKADWFRLERDITHEATTESHAPGASDALVATRKAYIDGLLGATTEAQHLDNRRRYGNRLQTLCGYDIS
jgi:hypothetical protein